MQTPRSHTQIFKFSMSVLDSEIWMLITPQNVSDGVFSFLQIWFKSWILCMEVGERMEVIFLWIYLLFAFGVATMKIFNIINIFLKRRVMPKILKSQFLKSLPWNRLDSQHPLCFFLSLCCLWTQHTHALMIALITLDYDYSFLNWIVYKPYWEEHLKVFILVAFSARIGTVWLFNKCQIIYLWHISMLSQGFRAMWGCPKSWSF